MKEIINKILNICFKQITELGGLIFYLVILGFCLVLNQIELFIKLFLSIVIVTIISVLIKLLYFKDRPKKQKKTNLFERLDASSFPSIHSMRIFSLAFWFSLFFNNIFFTISVSILALVIMYSRIYLKKHYLIDVIFGVIFSAFINIVLFLMIAL